MTTRDLQVTVRERNGAAVLELHGDIDLAAEQTLTRAYAEAARDGTQRVVLNFRHVGYMNSSGIALIVGLLAQARADAVRVGACGLSEHYREIFDVTRLSEFIEISDSEDGAARDTGGEIR